MRGDEGGRTGGARPAARDEVALASISIRLRLRLLRGRRLGFVRFVAVCAW